MFDPKARLRCFVLSLSRLELLTGLLAAAVFAIGLGVVGQGVYIKAKAALAQHLLVRAWHATAADSPQKPWPWADTWPVARLEVPRLNKDIVVLAGASGEAMAFAPGHVHGTPKAGHRGTAVFAAHRDTHFSFLRHVRHGDRVKVTNADRTTRTFIVTGARVVDATASGIDPHAPGTHLALVTCYPFAARTPGPLRYVVTARAEPVRAQTAHAAAIRISEQK